MNGAMRIILGGKLCSRAVTALMTTSKSTAKISSSGNVRCAYLLRRHFSGDAPVSPADPVVEKGDKKTASPKVLELVDKILELNVLEVNQLMFRLQTRLGISDDMIHGGGNAAAAPIGGGGTSSAAPAAAAPVAPKDAFDIKLTVVDAKAKIKIIKEIRVITGLGLAESKALVEKAPVVIKEGVKKEEADKIKKLLIDAGAGVEVL